MTLFSSMANDILFDFTKTSDIRDWVVVDDVVMGGKSSGNFEITAEGLGLYEGKVNLDNNGGFSSLRYRFKKKEIKKFTKIILKIKGDGKNYQFRVKANSSDYYSYITPFSTTGEWQEIEISLKEMYPTYRGRKLDKPNLSTDYIEEITFLIGNKKREDFKLLIDNIQLK